MSPSWGSLESQEGCIDAFVLLKLTLRPCLELNSLLDSAGFALAAHLWFCIVARYKTADE